MKNKQETIFFVMGVSGTGKSTIAKLLAEDLEIPFFDADDYHSTSNKEKMAAGLALNDCDREEWLVQLNSIALEHVQKGAVIACSALKKSYRTILIQNIPSHYFVFLEGSYELILKRIALRENHFMPRELLQSQFDTLEVPDNSEKVIRVAIEHTPAQLIQRIKKTVL